MVDIQNVVQHRVVTKELIQALPTGRNVQGLAALIPGVVIYSGGSAPSGQDVGGKVMPCPQQRNEREPARGFHRLPVLGAGEQRDNRRHERDAEPRRCGVPEAERHELAPELVIWECDTTVYRAGWLRAGIVGPAQLGTAGYLYETPQQPILSEYWDLIWNDKLSARGGKSADSHRISALRIDCR